MSRWKCYYHIVWTTKHRQPRITSLIEPIIFHAIEQKCLELRCQLLGINGTEDHIHLALSIAPSLCVADVIGQVKGVSSRTVNQTIPQERFLWQESYGVLTFGEKVMPQVLTYIARQKEHHQQGTFSPYLEQTDE